MKDFRHRPLPMRPLRRKALCAALGLALGWPAAHAQSAAVRPDGSTATTTQQAPNGVPVVNIAAPNAAGLSHNRYRQFDVGAQGLILNNSGAISSTQLAGYVYGNPDLSSGAAARLILNEVTSTAPSRLQGVLEVAGRAADVVVANPNGIDCNGCGFINATRGVLATGTPVLGADGTLSALRVTGGTLTIGGQGLDGSGIDRVDLIARAVAVNAGLWANRLNVVTGANRVDYATLATQKLAGTGAAPALALDVSALGGMYAGAIRLVGTEAGLGVNSQGQVAAQDGDLTLTSAGQVVLGGKTGATGNVAVEAAQSVASAGTLAAGGALRLDSGGDLNVGGTLYSDGAMTLTAGGALVNRGQVQSQGGALTLQAAGTLANAAGAGMLANGPVAVHAGALDNAGRLESVQGMGLTLQGAATNAGVLQADQGGLVLSAATLGNGGRIAAGGDASLGASTSLGSTGTLVANGKVTLSAPSLSTAGTIQAGQSLAIAGGSLSSAGKLYALGGDWTAQLSGAFNGASGSDIYGAGKVGVQAASFVNAGGVEARQALSLTSGGELRNQGTLQADGGDATLAAGTLDNDGTVSARAHLHLGATGALTTHGQAVAGGDVDLGGARLDTAGLVQAGGRLDLGSAGDLVNAGRLYALGGNWTARLGGAYAGQAGSDVYGSGDLALHAAAFANAGTFEAERSLAIQADHALGNSGLLRADQGNLTLGADALSNGGRIGAGGDASLGASTSLGSTGTLVANGKVTLSAPILSTAGTIQAGQSLAIAGGSLSSAGKLYALGGDWTAQLSGAFNGASGSDIYGAGNVGVRAASFVNAGGVEAGRNVQATVDSALDNRGAVQADQGSLAFSAATLSNDGQISAGSDAGLSASTSLGSTGTLVANGKVTLSAPSLGTAGTIQAGQSLAIAGGSLSNAGKLYALGGDWTAQLSGAFNGTGGSDVYAAGNVGLRAASFVNAGGVEAGRNVQATVNGALDNRGAVQADQGSLALSAGTLGNGGRIAAGGDASLGASTSLGSTGTLVANGKVTLSAPSLGTAGTIQAGQSLAIAGGSLSSAGKLYALGGDWTAQLSGAFDGASGSDIYGAGKVGVQAASFVNAGGVEARQALSLTSGGELRNQGTLQADGGDATLAAGTLDNDGTVSAQANLRVQAAGAARNGGVLVGGQAVALSATGLSNDAGGQVQSGTDLSLSAATLANAGRLYAKGNATVEGHGLSNAAGALLLADGALTIDSDGDLANNGVLQAGTDLMLGRASSLSNAAGATVYAGRDLDLAVAHALANGGMLYAAHAASVAAGSVDNPGTLRSGGSLSLDSAGRLDSAGAIQAQQDLVLASAGPFSNAGKLYAIDGTLRIDAAGAFASAASGDVYAGQDVTLAAGSIDNAGVLEAGGNAGLMAQGAAGNSGTVQADRGDLALGGATVANQGVLSAFGQLQLTGANGLSNAGQAVAGRSLRLAGGSLANSGQMQSGADAVLRLAGIDNGGRIQAGGALAISGNQRLTNAAGGQLLAAGDLEADSAQSLDNAGVLQAGGNLVLSGAGTLQNRAGGTLYGTGRADLRFGGALENAGTLYAGQAFNLAAGALDNAGLLRSGGALQAHVQGDATNAGTAYALGTATWNLGGALLDDGVLAAAGDVALTAGRLDGAGTLAAGLRGDGTLGTTGTLAVTTTGTLAAHGRNLAGGDLVLRGSAVDLSGSQTRAGGDASLAAAQGDVDNRGGDLAANGTLTVQAQGALRNGGDSAAQGGKLSAQALALRAASLDNRYGTLMQSGNGNLALAFGGAFDNAHGTLAANAHDITIDAAALDNSGGAIRHAGTGTLSLAADGDLTNAGGQIAGNGSLAVRAGGTLDNAGGTLGVAGTADVRALTMDNGGGTLAAGAATLTLTQALTNLGGTLQAGGSLTVNAGALDNTGGYLKATGSQALGVNVSGALTNAGSGGAGGFIGGNGAVSLGAGSLRNAGRVYAGTTLAANSQGALDNSGGALQAMGSLAASAAATLGNRGGRIEAGAGNGAATLDVHGAGIDNTGGRIANAGAGASTIGAGGAIANQGGTLGGQGDVSLAASALDNRQSGHVAAGHDLALDLGGLDNRGGVLYAAGDLGWSHAGAQLANAGGSLGAGGSLSLALGAVDNAGGELAADGDVTLDLGAFTGTGRAAAGRDLTLELAGGYTNGVGNTLKANRDLALVLGGDFVNPAGAVLQAVRHLSVHAAGIANAAGADIASAATDLQASGDLTNAGRIEGDEVTLRAANLANTGTLIGGHIAATANTLTNGADLGDATGNAAYQSALIAATDGIDLYVGGTLLNRDATIFTLGDLTLAADASGRRSQAVINRSGDIEADGDVFLAATQFTNERRVFETTVHTLSADEQARNSRTGNPVARYRYDDGDPDHQPPSVDPSQVVGANELAQADAYCGANNVSNTQRCVGYGGGSGTAQSFRAVETDTALRQTLLSRTSAEGRLLAGNDITLSGSVRNDKSTLAAGHDLTINGQAQSGEVGSGTIGGETVQNIAWTPTVQVGRSMAEQVEFEHLQHDPRRWEGGDFQTYGTSQSSVELGLAQATQMFGALQASASADARITAGDTVAITAHTIDNTVVGADGRPVHNAIGLGANGGAQAVTGKGAGTVAGVAPTSGGAAGVALGTAPGAVAGGSLGLAQGRNGAGAGQGPAAGSVAATGVAAAGTIDAAGGPAAGTPATVSTANGAPPAATGVAAGGHAGTGAPLPPQTVANLAGPQPTVSLPQSGLYTIHSDPGSPYLVETDPRFTSYTQFISSDYLLDQLGLDPSSLHKRLGDGFYEERSVLDQITSLTGRRFLSDATDALAQYRALMDAGVQVAQQFDLSVGVALTPEQMASLTQDMVWLVNVTVDGQTVLTPVVYLSAEHARELASGGATIAGKHVLLTADGDLTNNGTIAASQDAQLKAANLLNGGDIRAGGDLSIAAAQDILNGGTVSAGGSVSLVAGNDVRSGVNVAQALGSVNLTDPGAPVSTVALTSLQPGSLVAGQSLAVSAGRDLSLDQAPVQAGGELRLAAGRDLTATATAITAGGDAQLLAGRDLTLAATAHTVRSGGVIDGVEATTHTVSTLTAGGTAALSAGRDLSSLGAQVSGATVGVSAGRDLLATAVTDTARTAGLAVQGHKVTTTHTEDQTVRGSTFEGGQGVNLLAGRDATLTAAAVRSEQGAVTLAAGHDVTLDAAAESHAWTQDAKTSSHGLLSSQTTRTHDATSDTYAIGSTLSGATVTVAAGNDLTARAAQLTAQGALGLTAGHDVTLAAGEQSHGEEHSERVERSSFFSTSRKRFGSVDPESYRRESATASTQTWSVGTTVSGDTVTIGAGHDLHGTAAQIAGTHDVTLAAGHDLVLDAGQDTYTESDGTKVSRTGLMNGGGFSVLIGNRTTQADTTVRDVGYTGSLVGSTDGQVTLSAGHDVHLTGSDVLSRTGTTVVGQNVTIDAALGSTDVTQQQRVHTGGITVGVGGALAGAATAVYGDARRGGQVSDSRLKALYATKAAYDAKDLASLDPGAYQAASQDNANGINLQVGIGGSTASSETRTHDETSDGSEIRSQGDVTIAATGGDLNIVGSTVGGNNVALAAAHDLNIESQAEHHTLKSDNRNASGGVGLQIGTDGIGFYAEASVGKGNAHGNGATHAESHIDASDTLSLIAGNDATLKGAQLTGHTILANVGHDLNVVSEQDTDDYASQQWQVGGKVVVGMGASASGSASYGKTDSHYASVNEVTGLQAGAGGYQVHVGDSTHLVGGQLASTASPDKNVLDTGRLIAESLHNESKYSAVSVSVSGGSGGAGFGGVLSSQHHDASSDTMSGIAAGTVIVHDGGVQGDLHRDQTTLDGNGIKNGFDAQKVADQQELGQVAGYVGMRSVGALAGYMADHATTAAERKAWSAGGANEALLHGLVGAATAALGGGNAAQGALGASASEAASGAMATYLADHGIDPNGAQGKVLMELASTAIGGTVGGASGASTALQGEQYNRQLHLSEQQLAQSLAANSGGRYTTQQIEDALRLSGYSLGAGSVMPGETSQTGSLVNVKDAGSIYDPHASWVLVPGPNGSQYLMQQVPAQVSPDLAAYIIANTGGASSPYSWAPEQEGRLPVNSLTALSNWADSNHVGTRALGGLQMVGGGLEMAGGVLAASTCETGIGCVGAMYLAGAGLDNAKAGSDTLVNGQPTATLGEQGLQWMGLSPNAAALVYGATQLVPAGVEGYAINVAADAQAVANAAARQSYIPIDEFNPLGVKVTPEVMQTPQAQLLLQQYLSNGIPKDIADSIVRDVISTGVDIPEIYPVHADTALVKLVPKNASGSDVIKGNSPFFVTMQEYQAIKNMSTAQIADYLGLPAEQGIRGATYGFDVYVMTPKSGSMPVVFSSKVAPIQQGVYSANGGAEQILVPNRSLWTDPNASKINSIRVVH